MKKKIIAIAAVASVLCAGAALVACNKVEQIITPHTVHCFERVDGIAATCVESGLLKHDRCIYCNKTFIGGEEQNVVLPIDPTAHELSRVAEVFGCTIDGIAEHDRCELCDKYFIEGEEVTAEDIVLPATNTHTWDESGMVCKYDDGYKLLYNGEYRIIDGLNGAAFVPCKQGAYSDTTDAATKQKFYDSLFENRMTFFTQTSDTTKVTATGDKWVINNSESNQTKNKGNFTRFSFGEGSEGYIGRFLLAFDVTVSADITADRFGVKVVDSTAKAYDHKDYAGQNLLWSNVSKLLGSNASEENNADRKFTPGTTYRFVYELETTESKQMVQIFTCFAGAADVTISDLHCEPIDGTTGKVDYKLVYFGEAELDGFLIKEGECTHTNKYAVPVTTATCKNGGTIEHEHCPVCGKNYIDGNETSEKVNTDKVDHDYGGLQAEVTSSCSVKGHAAYYQCGWCENYFDENKKALDGLPEYDLDENAHEYGELVTATDSTCTVKGHDAYYHCDLCNKYFDESKKALDGVPEKELVQHSLGDWKSDASGHWKVCAVCEQKFDKAAHIPGPEATETTDQTCTECGYVLVPSASHTHSIALVPEKKAAATENGNIEHYACSGCHKTFSDPAGENELSDVVLEWVANIIAGADNKYNATLAQDTNPGFLAKPGHWVAQTQTANASATINNGVLNLSVGKNSKDKTNKIFVRALPAKEDGTAFVGTYIWNFDFEVTEDTKLFVGHFIQRDDGKTVQQDGVNVAVTDVAKEFKADTVYRFSLFVETLNANEYVQLNVRNAAGYGGEVKISNASYVFYPEHVNTGAYRIQSINFATPVEQQPATATITFEAILPDNKSFYAA